MRLRGFGGSVCGGDGSTSSVRSTLVVVTCSLTFTRLVKLPFPFPRLVPPGSIRPPWSFPKDLPSSQDFLLIRPTSPPFTRKMCFYCRTRSWDFTPFCTNNLFDRPLITYSPFHSTPRRRHLPSPSNESRICTLSPPSPLGSETGWIFVLPRYFPKIRSRTTQPKRNLCGVEPTSFTETPPVRPPHFRSIP